MNFESRIPRLPQRLVEMRDRALNDHCFASDLSSFNRNGFDSSFSQSAHHTVRLSARENIKSASLSAQQQTASKLQEKLKCVIDFFISSLSLSLSFRHFLSEISFYSIKIRPRKSAAPVPSSSATNNTGSIRIYTSQHHPSAIK